MYLSYFDLKQNPFQISTDPQFLWLGEKHEEALATLRYGVEDNKGFLLLTGDVGTGKTTLINALLKMLDSSIQVATIRDPGLELMDFYNYTAHVFAMEGNFTSKSSFLIQFERFLSNAHEAGRRVLLIIDEAQRISQELLEEVRLLSNIEKEDTKLLNIFFVGQVEFNEILLKPANRAIRQRITVNYNIPPLSVKETTEYIQHRLRIAGTRNTIFSDEAFAEIFSYAKGYPRLINIVCDRALLTGFVEDSRTITPAQVRECIKELKISLISPLYKETKGTGGHSGLGLNSRPGDQEAESRDYDKIPENRKGNHMYSILFVAASLLFIFFGFYALSNPDFILRPWNSLNKSMAPAPPSAINQAETNQQETNQPEVNVPEANGAVIKEPESGQSQQLTPPTPPRMKGQQEQSTNISFPGKSEKAEADQNLHDSSADENGRERINNVSMISDRSELTTANQEESKEKNSAETTSTVPTKPNQNDLDIAVKDLVTVDKLVIPFPSDASLPAIANLKQIDNLVEDLKDDFGYTIKITGYSDSRGYESYNARLSEFRANAVKSYLIGKGLPAKMIVSRGLGSQNPIASNDSENGRKANRRVEIEVLR